MFSKPSSSALAGSDFFSTSSRCAFCREQPILPVHINCPHVYCYYCLESSRMIDMKYECPVCFISQNSAIPVIRTNIVTEGIS